MLADLKKKAAGVDRKRVYTAAAALLIAGAAGHFMQRTAGGAGNGPAMMSASVPPVSAPEILAAPAETAAPEIIAAGPVPEIVPAEAPTLAAPTAPEIADSSGTEPVSPGIVPAETDVATADASPVLEPTPDPAESAAPELAVLGPAKPRPAIVPEVLTPEVLADTGTASTAIYPAPKADLALEEVTRAATDPLLTITEPAPDRADETVMAAASEPVGMPAPDTAAPADPEMAACAIDVQGVAKPGALLEISVTAPCNSGEAVGFAHAGLKFNEQLGPDGSLIVEVPAMTGSARVALSFADGSTQDLDVSVPDFDAFDRIAVIWQGATGLQLHALEGGADYGEAGHKWADTPGTPDAALTETGGFLSVLGSTAGGYAADIYTYPAALMRQGTEPEVSIEAQVMESTCGGKIKGQILRTNPGRAPNIEPLTMVVPGCDAVGEILVLRNLPVELKLARR